MQVSLMISPLRNIKANTNRFVQAYSCTGEKTINIGQNISNQLHTERVAAAKSFVDAIHSIL